MIDATIVIPTFRHAALLPYALRSALDQDGASIEVFVVGDGVQDDTRAALEPFREDVRSGGDADLCWRLAAAGWELERRTGAAVVHRNRATIGALLKGAFT